MKFGFYLIPVMAASAFDSLSLLFILTCIYLFYLFFEGKKMIKELQFSTNELKIFPIIGNPISVPLDNKYFDAHIYKGTKFFESKMILISSKYKVDSNYWSKNTFEAFIEELEGKL